MIPKRAHFVEAGGCVFRPVSTAVAAVLIEEAAAYAATYKDTERTPAQRTLAYANLEDLYWAMIGIHWAGEPLDIPSWRKWRGDWGDYGALVRDAATAAGYLADSDSLASAANALVDMLTTLLGVEVAAKEAENFTATTPPTTVTPT